MFKFLYPDLYVDSIYKIQYRRLLHQKINCLIFDIDNTLVPHFVKEPTEDLIAFISKLKGMGFKICILSNASEKRVSRFTNNLDIPVVHRARKPFLYGVSKAMDLLSAETKNTAIIGDQIFTDVWCGNRMKIYSILVKPVSEKDEFLVKLKRGFERIVMNEYIRKGGKK